MTAAEHRALVVTTPTAAARSTSGASLRVRDVVGALERAGLPAVQVRSPDLASATGRFCVGVAVSYASVGALRALRARCDAVWLDAVDSWLLVDGSGLRSGDLTYAARFLRDGARLVAAPSADLVTWISGADRARDRGTVRGRVRLVLPPADESPPVSSAAARPRAVLAGDWGYPPNRDGLTWFGTRVLPLLEQQLHGDPRVAVDWSVDVYGPSAPSLSGRLRRQGYADASELYRAGDVHLGPVRHGAGVKRKVLQPLLAGLPVVTTAAGAHGLRAHPLLDVCGSAEEFAGAVARRLRSPASPAPVAAGDVVDVDETADVLRWVSRACTHR